MVGRYLANKSKSFLCGGLGIWCNSSRINKLRTGQDILADDDKHIASSRVADRSASSYSVIPRVFPLPGSGGVQGDERPAAWLTGQP
jgi:hypothetical protein